MWGTGLSIKSREIRERGEKTIDVLPSLPDLL
jgi:hypothetical protein